MKQLLFLQDIGVDHYTVQELMSKAGLPFEPSWKDPPSNEATDSVEAIVTVNSKVDEAVLKGYANLRMVAVAFTGYDCVDLKACEKRGIRVYNVPSYSTDSVAELTIALAVSLLRDIPSGNQDTRNMRNERDAWWKGFGPGTELAGKTVGIIGTGRIGLRVAELFRAFKCKVIAWSRTHREEFTKPDGLICGEYLPLDEVFSRADVVSLHIGLNNETRDFVGKSCWV